MEKNQSSCPKVVFEKIFRSITLGPAFTTIRRISNRQQTPSSTARNSPQPPKPSSKQGSEVPIKFDYTTAPPTEKPKPVVSAGNAHQLGGSKLKPSVAKGNGKSQVQNHDDIFAKFIHETRRKITSPEPDNGEISQKVGGHGHGHGSGRKDHQFSDYIKQTKRKIKSTLSSKDRSESFFK
ncbi:hypothetical protein ERO13_A08G070100v2 [Gossypium hirsutum]|uniref:Uncharacterized protein n=4 Tax=Gossypium TaxID=3633 RepID=A0A2P5XSF6_GOSBA|nr:hypothetical protein ES319_A08G077400v1 [Gossypium barbadense]KAG4186873.1 hypothetical protein ERO13_A08G070100v2 [Gossypium hirsutum]KAK5811249.1 hypothetical protein PVK06_026573 [Gossypium arboreum]TYH05431.1 hypothetical protein ES288_A08G082600v1 [Gossypium darwinii]TYJ21717.1 hypothetical protein E1A91_A08G081200v1 [Gossypium mustelinum]